MNTPFKGEERSKFLKTYYDLLEKSQDLGHEIVEYEGNAPDSIVTEADNLNAELSEMRDEYVKCVPVLPLSRCPYTNKVVYHSIDHYGLDGLWWDSQVPLRPIEVLPSTFYMVNGAVKLGKIEQAPIIVKPGPEAPYVVPEIIGLPQFKAVVSQIRVGNHVAYPIFYFIEDWEKSVEPMNNWGTNYWQFLDADGKLRYHEYGGFVEEIDPDYSDDPVDDDDDDDYTEYTFDFDLEKWVKQGKLLWIAPDDPSFMLKTGTSGCPYLNLEGSHEFSVIYDGELTEPLEEEI